MGDQRGADPEECDHSNPSVEIIVAPTCTEDGYKVTKCSRCGKELGSRTKTANALGHQFVETTVAPTCTESGYTVKKCTRCGEEEGERTNLVAPLGHEYKNGVCIRCGAPEPQENGGSSSAAPNYTVTGAETYETSVVDGRYIIAYPLRMPPSTLCWRPRPSGDRERCGAAPGAESSRQRRDAGMGPMLPLGLPNGGEARLTINGAVHNELARRRRDGEVLSWAGARQLQLSMQTKNHLNLKDPSGFLLMELLSRFELETSSLPRMRSTN